MGESPNAVPSRLNAVPLIPGFVEYATKAGKTARFYFQANPSSLARSRSVALTKTAGRKSSSTYARRAGDWKIAGVEIALDASRPHWTALDKQDDQDNLKALVDTLEHLEALVDVDSPLVTLTLGRRRWQGYVTELRIEEKQFTSDLIPMRIVATLSLDVTATLHEPGELLGPKNGAPAKSTRRRRRARA